MDETNPNAQYARALHEMVDVDLAELDVFPVIADLAVRQGAPGRRTLTDHVDALGQRIYTQWDANGWAIAAWPVTEFGVRKGIRR